MSANPIISAAASSGMTEDSGLESFKALLSTASSTIGGAEPVKVTETVAD